jgi:predicted Kef-type K+ transport protein
MHVESIWICFAVVGGITARFFKLPTLVGYLAAGFAINYFSSQLNLDQQHFYILDHISHLGVLLLLFTIGLKIKVNSLLQSSIIGTSLLHFIIISLIYYLVLTFSNLNITNPEILLIGIALSFSSTVLSAKVLDSNKEIKSFHGRTAIGILIIQDVVALVVIALATSTTPSIYSPLLIGIFLLKPLLFKLFDSVGRDDLFLLTSIALSLVIGGQFFELAGISSELGALMMGFMLSSHKRSSEISASLLSIKEFFLIGFFLKIGLSGLPTYQDWSFAALMTLLLPLKTALFFFLLILFKLRARSAFITSMTLTAYSEFGLIVASKVIPEYLTPLALTVAISFLLSSPINRGIHSLYQKICKWLIPFERDAIHPDELSLDLKNSQILIMGFGRVGKSAYDHLATDFRIIAMDSDPEKILENNQEYNLFYADAEDHHFWSKLSLNGIESVILAMNDQMAKINSIYQLRQRGFNGTIISNCSDEEDAEKMLAVGATEVHLQLKESGISMAEFVKNSEREHQAEEKQ